jgi:hypothetical protein
VDPKNYTQPLQQYYSDAFEYLSPKHSITFYYAYSLIEFVTDEGLIFQDMQKREVPQIHTAKTSYSFLNSDMISSLIIEGNHFGNKYNRSYQKIQDILTRSGGLIKALMLIGQAIAYLVSYSNFKIDSFFGYHNMMTPCKDKFKSNEMNINDSNFKENNYLHNTSTKNLSKIVKMRSENIEKPIKINPINYWCVKRKRKERIVLDMKEKLIDISLSQETLMRTHFDLEIMKFLLLSNDDLNTLDQNYEFLFCGDSKLDKIRDQLLAP